MRDQLGGAMILARIAHHGQTRMDGVEPFINHPRRVAARLAAQPGATYGDLIVAWLHDIVEDTVVTIDDLRTLDFAEDVISAVYSLTRQVGEPYADYIERVARNLAAVRVKLADLADNLESLPAEHTLRKRFEKARDRLLWLKFPGGVPIGTV